MEPTPSDPRPAGAAVVRASYDGTVQAAPTVLALLARGDVVLALAPPGRPDLAVLDAVARLVLAAKRGQSRLVVRADELAGLAGLCGLACLLGSGEPGRQAETGEQLRTEEVVDVGDPPP